MFTRVQSKLWPGYPHIPIGETAHSCTEVSLPRMLWIYMFGEGDAGHGLLGDSVEAWTWRQDEYPERFALGALFEGEQCPTLFVTHKEIFPDLIKFLEDVAMATRL